MAEPNFVWVKYPDHGTEGWANYQGDRYKPAPAPRTFWQSAGYLTSEAEGARYVAYNGYDRAISSFGLIQWTLFIHVMEPLLWDMRTADPEAYDACMKPFIDVTGIELVMTGKGPRLKDAIGIIETQPDMHRVINAGCSGKSGSWSADGKARHLLWAKCLVATGKIESLCQAHNTCMAKTIKNGYFSNKAKKFFGYTTDEAIELWDAYKRAMMAAQISFAVNLPAVADRCLDKVPAEGSWQVKFRAYINACLAAGIKPWPQRWNDIKKILAPEFGIDVSLTGPEVAAKEQPKPEPIKTPVVLPPDSAPAPVAIDVPVVAPPAVTPEPSVEPEHPQPITQPDKSLQKGMLALIIAAIIGLLAYLFGKKDE